EGIRVGSKVRVIKTRGDKLRIRAEASIKAKILAGAAEGSILEVIGGPKTADGYTWWQVRLNSTVGWTAQDWLEPLK
ncbi:MAG: SH3 domain-containing protein, partial [Anaerolineae bacterium]|nr:SH3 domain-containing protein [Anaerolineae bacterium]